MSPLSSSPVEYHEDPSPSWLLKPSPVAVATLARIKAPAIEKWAALLIINNQGHDQEEATYLLEANPIDIIKAWFLSLECVQGTEHGQWEILQNSKRVATYYQTANHAYVTLKVSTPQAPSIAGLIASTFQ